MNNTTVQKDKGAGSQTSSTAENKVTPSHSNGESNEDLPLDLEAVAKQLNREVLDVIMLPVGQMIQPIKKFADRARSGMLQAKQLHALSRLNCWATGRALINAKSKLDHGEFGPWVKEHFLFSKSSAENYMKLARDYSTAELFLEELTPLRELYANNDQATEDITPTKDGDTDNGKIHPPSKAEALLKSLTNLQKRMRHVTESDEPLEDYQIEKLKLIKDQIDRFFETIINQTQSHEL